MPDKKTKSEIIQKRVKREKGGFFRKCFKWFFILTVTGALCAAAAGTVIYLHFCKDLPRISSLKDYRPKTITTVYSDTGEKIAEFYRERRIVIPLEEMPDMLLKSFVAAEDARFYIHSGIDFFSIIRAFYKNIEAGGIVQGGSTITQQVTKSFFLSPERSYSRKIKEAILAYRIDKTFTKNEILYLYLNQIYLGHGAYGVEAASENYFNKKAKDLTLPECAMLAGLPQAPSRYSPFRHPERAKERQIYVLGRMVAEGFITAEQETQSINTVLDIKPRRNWFIEKAPHYTEHIRRYVEKKYGPEALYENGLKIYTAVNLEMQQAAGDEVRKGLEELDKRRGYRGPLKHMEKVEIEAFSNEIELKLMENLPQIGDIVEGVVIGIDNNENTATVRIGSNQGIITIEDMKWARKPDPEVAYWEKRIHHPGEALKQGDVVLVKIKGTGTEDASLWDLSLEQTPDTQAALICMESDTGMVKAMIGGREFRDSQFNRAIQSRRQPGSAFKPFIFAAAIDKGYTPASVIIDSPVIFQDEERDFTWKPKNYGNKWHGPTLLRKAMAKSRNIITIKILQDIGIDYAINYSRRFGITSDLSRNLSIALGSSGTSLLEIVNAYSVFNNRGRLTEPVFVTRIEDRNGSILEENIPKSVKVIDESTAYIMTSMLESAVQEGTGHRAKALKRPVAGKTGTTNNLFDAWFVGYTPRYTTGTWVGFDEEKSLGKGETGSRASCPIWTGFMKKILKDKSVQVFQVPDSIVFAKIDAETGLLPIPESKHVILECFKDGTVPTEHTQRPDSIIEKDDFFKMEF